MSRIGSRSSLRYTLAAAILILLDLAGCVAVKPWEREFLARPGMGWEEDARLSAIEQHIYFSKEATFSSTGTGGGGCGCN